MAEHTDSDKQGKPTEPPAPEVLRVQADDQSSDSDVAAAAAKPKSSLKSRRSLYRPSHKATFIGLSVVAAILLINVGIIIFIINMQGKSSSDVTLGGVTISPTVLDALGVSRNTIGSTGTELVVNPNSKFSGNLTVAGDVSIAGQLKLNSNISATGATLSSLTAGAAALDTLNVNGDATISNLNLRKDLIVAGQSQLQGAVTIYQLLTVNNNINVTGNLSVGGTLSIGAFQTNTLTIGGHIITRGSAPGISSGSAVGNNGTVGISGNDTAGTVSVNTGTGAGNGIWHT